MELAHITANSSYKTSSKCFLLIDICIDISQLTVVKYLFFINSHHPPLLFFKKIEVVFILYWIDIKIII